MRNLIPVICDRCRAEGVAGEAAFADLGDLLDFEPVKRKKERVDGWDAERQRAFIAALAVTGSKRRAAVAVGKSPFGVDQLLKSEGSESFAAAHDRAMAIARETGRHRLAAGIDAVAGQAAAWTPPAAPWSHAATRRQAGLVEVKPEPELGDAKLSPEAEKVRRDLLGVLVHKYMLKLEAERRCRLEGRIAEADFYLRQVTMLEVSLDVVSGDGMRILKEASRGNFDLLDIAETEMSKLLDEARRQHWEACGDPPRPEYPPRHLLNQHDGFATVSLEYTTGGLELSHEEQRRRFDEQHARDAEAHVRWEAEARRDHEARRAAGKLDDA